MIHPIYSKFDYDANRWIWGLNKEDFQKVRAGYACDACLEDFNGVWRPKCPVCGNEIEAVVETPREWR